MKVGCGITTYNRPQADKYLIESLNKADTENVVFYIFHDGSEFPKHWLDLNGEKLISTTQKHLGLPLNIWRCINTVFERHDTGVFLENDLAVSHDFFPFMLNFLEERGGIVASSTTYKGEGVKEVQSIAGKNWTTTSEIWEETKPLLEEFIEHMKKEDYLNIPAKDLIEKYGSATQDGIRSKAFKAAGFKIWRTLSPKVRVTVKEGVHGAKEKELEVTQELIDQ